eukprot:5977677-Prymnesium_polylepis.1
MHDWAHRQCAGEAGLGTICRSSCKPLTHALPSCLAMVSSSTRTTPPASLNEMWTIGRGVRDPIGSFRESLRNVPGDLGSQRTPPRITPGSCVCGPVDKVSGTLAEAFRPPPADVEVIRPWPPPADVEVRRPWPPPADVEVRRPLNA